MSALRYCPNCDKADPDLAHAVFEAVAMTLAEPLRQAFREHLDKHGCGTGDDRDPRYMGGFAHCSEAWGLFCLLPDGDSVMIG